MLSKNKIKYIRSLSLKKNRTEERVFVAEGPRLLSELLPTFHCHYLASTQQWAADNSGLLRRLDVQPDIVTPEELKRVSSLETPQDVIAIFEQPRYEVDPVQAITTHLCLALDDVQNPGNLGTIIRLADWFGITDIFCSRATADVYNPKVVQATMGGLTRVRVHYVDLSALLASLPASTPVYGTFLNGQNIYHSDLSSTGLIIMGNEGNGISQAVAAHVSHRLTIPNYPEGATTTESLNVAIATAIVCAEFRRRG